MIKSVIQDKSLEEKLQLLLSSIINDNDYISIGSIVHKREECSPIEKLQYDCMVEIYESCDEYINKNYAQYVRSDAPYKVIYIEYNGIKYEIVKCPTDIREDKTYTGYIFEKQRIKNDNVGDTVCCENLELSISGNNIITSFASDKIINDNQNYFVARKEKLEILAKFKETIYKLCKSDLLRKQMTKLIDYFDEKNMIDGSSSQYDKVFMYTKKKKSNR